MAQTQTRPPQAGFDQVTDRSIPRVSANTPTTTPVAAGILAGSVVAVAVDLLSLLLTSPHDGLLNTVTLGAGALVLGLISGLALKLLSRRPARMLAFAGMYVVFAAITLGAAALMEDMLSGTLAFVLPLAVVALPLSGGLNVVLAPRLGGRWWINVAAAALAVVTSVGLANRGHAERVPLALPSATAVPEPKVAPIVLTQPIAEAPAAQVQVPVRMRTPGLVATVLPKPIARMAGQYAGVNFIVGTGSKATFTVGEQIARMPLPSDAVVSTSALSGEIHLDGRPSTIRLDLWKLSSDQPRRDRYIKNTMFANSQIATFTVGGQAPVPDGTPLGEAVTGGRVRGTLELKDKEFPITFEMNEARDDGDAVYLLGNTNFTWHELDLQPPSSTGILQINNDVAVQILLLARPKPSGS